MWLYAVNIILIYDQNDREYRLHAKKGQNTKKYGGVESQNNRRRGLLRAKASITLSKFTWSVKSLHTEKKQSR